MSKQQIKGCYRYFCKYIELVKDVLFRLKVKMLRFPAVVKTLAGKGVKLEIFFGEPEIIEINIF